MTAMSENPVAANYLSFAVRRMQLSVRDINACAELLSEEQLWHRQGDYENSVANLLLHLAGNIRQWILHGVAGQPDVRKRDEEFTLQPSMSGAEARARFNEVLEEAIGIIAAVPHERLLAVINPQPGSTWENTTILEAIFLVSAHLQEHKGQIVLLAKQLTHSDLDLSMPRKR